MIDIDSTLLDKEPKICGCGQQVEPGGDLCAECLESWDNFLRLSAAEAEYENRILFPQDDSEEVVR